MSIYDDPDEAARRRRPRDNENWMLRADNAAQVRVVAREQHEAARAKVDEQQRTTAAGYADVLTEQGDRLSQVRERFETEGRDPFAELHERRIERAEGRQVSGDLYQQALAQHEGLDPFDAAKEAARTENEMFNRGLDAFDARIEAAKSRDAQCSLEQQKDIYAADQLALISHRIADQEELITGVSSDLEEDSYRDNAREHEGESAQLRKDYRTRTGRVVPTPEHELSNHVVSEAQRGDQQRQAEASEKVRSAEANWTDVSIQLTADQRGRLVQHQARLESSQNARDGSREEGQEEGLAQPTRPTGRGGIGA